MLPPSLHRQWAVGEDDGVGRHQTWKRAAEEGGDLGIDGLVPGSDVGMGERGRRADPRERGGQGLPNIAEDQVPVVRNAIRMRRHLPIEDKDLAVRKQGPKVIECPAIAQTQLQNRPRGPGDQSFSHVEACALGAKPADNAVESAHVLLPVISEGFPSRSTGTGLRSAPL